MTKEDGVEEWTDCINEQVSQQRQHLCAQEAEKDQRCKLWYEE